MESYVHNTGTFIGKGGIEIFFQSWTVPSPRGVLVIVHGVGEHSGRYGNIINELKGSKISIYALDHRGHGRSSGKHGHVDSFMDYVYDLKLFIDYIKEDAGNMPLILHGHSMGGIIACKYALTYTEDLAGLALSSPAFRPVVDVPSWKTGLAGMLSRYAPSFTMATGLEAKDLSHDDDVVEAYENDPLVHDKVSSKWYMEFTKTCEECLNRALELRVPLLVFHGRNDRIVDSRASETFCRNSSSINKECHIIDGFYHETMNELEKGKVLPIVSRWLMKIMSIKKAVKRKTVVGRKRAAVKVKKTARKASRKSAKKTAKKTVKKKVKKTARKAVKKTVKKKALKKAEKRTAKKKVKKSVKKTARRKAAGKAVKKATRKAVEKSAAKKTAKKAVKKSASKKKPKSVKKASKKSGRKRKK
jgi:alpha-beta hydrolase superfamily lysophospholipase